MATIQEHKSRPTLVHSAYMRPQHKSTTRVLVTQTAISVAGLMLVITRVSVKTWPNSHQKASVSHVQQNHQSVLTC